MASGGFSHLFHGCGALIVGIVAHEVERNVCPADSLGGFLQVGTVLSRLRTPSVKTAPAAGLFAVAEKDDTFPSLLAFDVAGGPGDGAVEVRASAVGNHSYFRLAAALGAAPVGHHVNSTVECGNRDAILGAKHLHETV